ncbi:MAG: MGH1-like glycoside hydrolase domain-containing protein [Candidatus Cyclobacteriaceae bacterium M3_2C_046]
MRYMNLLSIGKLLIYLIIFSAFTSSFAQKDHVSDPEALYQKLQENFARGWNTWNPRSTTSFVDLPSAFSITIGFKDYLNPEVMTETIPQVDHEKIWFGGHTYDGSYTDQEISYSEMKFKIQSATEGDELVLLVTPIEVKKVKTPTNFVAIGDRSSQSTSNYTERIKLPLVLVEIGMLWNRTGSLSREGDRLIAQTPTKKYTIHATQKPVEEYYVGSIKTPYLALKADQAIGISTNQSMSLDQIRTIISRNKSAWEKEKARYAAEEEVYNAMQTCLAWNTFFDPQDERVITPVSRLWSYTNKGYVLYLWDTYFGAYQAAATGHKAIAYANAKAMTDAKTEGGFVPNNIQANGFITRDRSQPPVGSLCIREIYRKFGERWFLELLYDDLLQWNRWWAEKRDYQGLLSYGSNVYEPVIGFIYELTTVGQVHGWFGASMESGWDGSIIYENQEFDQQRSIMKSWDASLNGLYVMDCRALADIAEVLGRKDEAREIRNRAGRYAQNLQRLWDDEDHFFKNKNWETGKFPDFKAINGFLPLLSGEVTEHQLEKLIADNLLNPAEFKTSWMIPTVPQSNPVFEENRYWDGRVWPPVNFLIYLALSLYDHPLAVQAKNELVQNSKSLLLKEWERGHYVRENYDSTTGDGLQSNHSASFYHWGGLLGLMSLIESGYVEAPSESLK